MTLPLLDSHVHLWDPHRFRYPWLGYHPALDRPFGPRELDAAAGVPVGVIVVEAGREPEQAAAEVAWVRELARSRPEIRGMVAHLSLERGPSAHAEIPRLAEDPFVLGVRRLLQDEPPGFTADPQLRAGVGLLGEAGLPFDACVREHQLPQLDVLVAACPQTVIVLDHLGKPEPAGFGTGRWYRALRRLADRPNVVCKLSGPATQGSGSSGPRELRAFLCAAVELFGPHRCLFGSDWPVLTLNTAYGAWLDLVRSALTGCSAEETAAVLGGNAARIYRVPSRH
ncbi:amidohydrolase family protein [Streptomyces sp. NPDC001922]|uniref:amidohydrolase family protein n=1 Tax=Streptomyces sp. NPDC001922 TaxID=3364624 RepID=UPI0036747685